LEETESSRAGIRASTSLTDYDVQLFMEGKHTRLYEKLGSHLRFLDGVEGASFAVWAPNARSVSVIGDFNGWNPTQHLLAKRADWSGVWEGFVPGLSAGAVYKYHIVSNFNDYAADKGDPFARLWELPPRTASVVWGTDHQWGDSVWMAERGKRNSLSAPMAIYEAHLGSWKRSEADDSWLGYRETAQQLAAYASEMGFTHVEFLPVMEHPFYGSWGYQTSGYFAPTSRYGTPEDMKYLVDHLHKNGIGVFLDWVPSHFPSDKHGLSFFDGTHLFEYADPRRGFHPDWKTCIFDYGRNEVRSFILSAANFWLDVYHADGLRCDAVSSMLYLDYSRKPGEWVANIHGGRENLEAISLLKFLNESVYAGHPDVQMMAEESTAWPMVSRPTYTGGLGFGMKWDLGWMHDTLHYYGTDPLFRKYHHDELTFSMWYFFSENFILPLSHDEVVHGKGSLLAKFPGDSWQKHANLRLLLGYMYGHPGKKLLFMGDELAERDEWHHDGSLNWQLLEDPASAGVQSWVKDLNRFLRAEPALHERDFALEGFEWVDYRDSDNSVVSFIRRSESGDSILVVCNNTPVPRNEYTLGVPVGGRWQESLNSDAKEYGGSGVGNLGRVEATEKQSNGRPYTLTISLPPLGCLFLKPENQDTAASKA
jgi:1,4-alpha-glucan branching enzyme